MIKRNKVLLGLDFVLSQGKSTTPKVQHEEIYPLHAVLGNHLMNTNRHGLKFDYVMGDGMHEWTQVLNLPIYYFDKT